jgi:hypothetical protein
MRNPFVVSSITWHEVPLAIAIDQVNLIEEALNEHLDLAQYGQITGLAFIFIIKPESNTIHENHISYSRKRKEIVIQMRVGYDLVQKSALPTVMNLLCQQYVETITKALPLKKVPHFDCARFGKDVYELFLEKGWVMMGELA